MSSVIKEYYEKAGVQSFLIENKLSKFEENEDIKKEFEYWILNKKFLNEVTVEGYKASDLAQISPVLNGEGAFTLLIELRENPSMAKQRIDRGFKIK